MRFCLDSEKGQTRKKLSLAKLIETYPGIRLWKKQYAAQMQELFEMIFDCVEYGWFQTLSLRIPKSLDFVISTISLDSCDRRILGKIDFMTMNF